MDRVGSRRRSKKLLVAAVGVATVNFVGCPSVTLGNLVAPEPCKSPDSGGEYCYPPFDSGVTDSGPLDASDAGTGAGRRAGDGVVLRW